jgi:integrase
VIARLRFIQKFQDRHGRVRLHLRRKGQKPIALSDEKDPGFLLASQTALAPTAPVPKVARVAAGSFEALTRSYVSSAKFKQLGPSTQAVYRRIIDDLFRKHGDKPVAMMQSNHIRWMPDAKAETPAAANHLLRTLRALMKYAVQEGIRPDDPTQGVDRLKEVGEGVETWTEEDIAVFEGRWPDGPRPRLALALLIYTGQRRSDVVRMGRQHVQDGVIEVRQVKTKSRLFIPLHPGLAAAIATETDRLTFLVTEPGKPLTPNGFYMRFKGWVEAAGLPVGRSPHGLRKAAARRLAEGGCTRAPDRFDYRPPHAIRSAAVYPGSGSSSDGAGCGRAPWEATNRERKCQNYRAENVLEYRIDYAVILPSCVP